MMSNAQMMNPQHMYGGRPVNRLTPAQRRRVNKKYRKIYGMWNSDKFTEWIERERIAGRPVR